MDVNKIREDFSVLQRKINGKPVIYFDNACMTLKPNQVIQAMNSYYFEYPGCGGRSEHKFGKRVTEEVEKARKMAQKFFNARNEKEIVFTKNTTESLNLVANSLDLKKGDVVLTTDKEHNSNLLPWQILSKTKGIRHEILKSNPDSTFNMEEFENRIRGVKLVSFVHTSNLDGVTIPAKEIIKIAHEHGSLVMLDAAQSAPHKEIDVRRLDVDFLACSGHKMLGPNGTGILYGKYNLLEELSPFIVGGDTVVDTTYESATFEKPPEKFEAGLQNYSGIIGLGEALKYLVGIGMNEIERHETILNIKITEALQDYIKIIGPKNAEMRSGIIGFNVEGMDNHEVALMLDGYANIMIRSGAHCVHSWFNSHGMKGSCRASLYLYNTEEECDIFIENMRKIISLAK